MRIESSLFYETPNDLFQILTTYCEAGLLLKQPCLLVLPENLLAAAEQALREAIPDFDVHLSGGSVELSSTLKLSSSERVLAGSRVATVMYPRHIENLPETGIASRCATLLSIYRLADIGALELADILARNKTAVCVRNGRPETLSAGPQPLDPGVLNSDHMQVQLRLKESQLDRSQRLAHVGTWHWDLRPGTLTWCPEICRILGRDAETYSPTVAGFMEQVYPEDRPALLAALGYGFRLGAGLSFKFRIVRPDGEIRHLRSEDEVECDSQGLPVARFGVLQDVTERLLAEELLRESNEEFRALSARLARAREDEGRRISREIHDELGATLTTLKWSLEAAGKLCVEAAGSGPLLSLPPRLEAMKNTVEQTLTAVRRIASELRPTLLDDLGLLDAIEWHAGEFQRSTGLPCACNWTLESAALNGDQATALFRILQEALTNVARHANATRVEIEAHQEGGEFLLTIRDDGRGMAASEQGGRRSLGLLGMRERAGLIGGTLQITSAAGVGTTIVVRAPLHIPPG